MKSLGLLLRLQKCVVKLPIKFHVEKQVYNLLKKETFQKLHNIA